MKKFLLASTALLLGASPALPQAITTLNTTVPGSGTGFTYCSAVVNTPPYWPCVQLRDAAGNLMSVNNNGQASAANSQPVVLPSTQVSADDCFLQKKTPLTITSSNTAATQLIGLISLQTIYICSITIKPTAATVFSLFEGTGTNCGSSPQAAVYGSLTAANGVPYSGPGDGITWGSGLGSVLQIANPGNALCFQQTVAEAVSITLTYVQSQL